MATNWFKGKSRAVRAVAAMANAEAAEAGLELARLARRRYRHPAPFLSKLADFISCQWYREADCESTSDFLCRVVGSSSPEWTGWCALAKLRDRSEVVGLVVSGELKMEVLAEVEPILRPENYRSWVWMCLHHSPVQMRKAVKAYRRMKKTGFSGPTVYVPLFVPAKEYDRAAQDENVRPWKWRWE